MRCRNCDSENREGARFCRNCGALLALICHQCGAQSPPDTRFCDECGTALEVSPAAAPEAAAPAILERMSRLVPKEYAARLLATRGQAQPERRLVTILFSDVSGYTTMTGGLDPEDVMEVMEDALQVLIGPIYRYEGTLARLMGDAILAFFGAPISHEDDAERACRAALEIIAGAEEYAGRLLEERGIPGFDVRVGISTGLVVVGEVGSDLRVEYTAMGDAIWVAKRVESAALPGTILVTEDTHRLVGPLFETEALEPIQVKGKAEPVPVYRVLAARTVPDRQWGIYGVESPLVGRETEFSTLRQAVEQVQSGVGGIVTLIADAGLGKSRLVAELATQVPPTAVRWVEGRCPSYGTSVTYLLWLDILRGLLGVTSEHPAVMVRDTLRERVETLCREQVDEIYPYLAHLMSLPLAEGDEGALSALSGERLKSGTIRAVETYVQRVADERPLVIVCEDLQWADPTSADVLEQLLSLTDRASVLFVCVMRPLRERGAWRIRETAARLYPHRHIDLWLRPLSTKESETLLSNLLRKAGPPAGLLEHVLAYAEGNPFYVEEITRALIDSGCVVQDRETGSWQAVGDFRDVSMPDTLHGVLMSRIDLLPEDTKRTLQAAAVIGRIFPYRLLEAIVGSDRDLDSRLVTLQREQMIRERSRIPEREYIFKHELTREAAYNGLPKTRRRLLHRRVAEVLEGLFPERIEEQVTLLAQHWQRGGKPQKAAHFWAQAGDRARRLGASLEAVRFYRQALTQAGAHKKAESDTLAASVHERLADVYVENLSRHDDGLDHYASFLKLAESQQDLARGERKTAMVYLLSGDFAQAQGYYERALDRLGTLPVSIESNRVHCGLAHLLVFGNRLHEAADHARVALEISRELGDKRGLADAIKAMGIVAYNQGELQEACSHFEKSLELYRALGDLPRIAQGCNNVGEGYRRLGQMEQALEYLNEGLEVARRIGDPRDEALLSQTAGELCLDQGQWEKAVAHLEKAQALAEQSGAVERIISVHLTLGSAHESMGQLEAARRYLERAETLSREMQYLHFAPRAHLSLACLCATEGDFDEAWRWVRLAEERAGPQPSDLFTGLLHQCQGYLYHWVSEWGQAVAHLEQCLGFLERAKLPAEVAKTRLSLGAAYASRGEEGDKGRACEQLFAALSTFRRIGAAAYVNQVEATLAEMGCQGANEAPLSA